MKLKPILLETEYSKKSPPTLFKLHGDSKLDFTGITGLVESKFYELYLIDTEAEIKGGDYFLFNLKEVHTACKDTVEICGNDNIAKIMASTDKLILGWDYKNDIPGGDAYNTYLPQLSNKSITLLVEYYNKNGKMPDEVEVNTTRVWNDRNLFKDKMGDPDAEYIINPQGTVDIFFPEEKLFTVNEVIETLKEHTNFINQGFSDSEKWFRTRNNL